MAHKKFWKRLTRFLRRHPLAAALAAAETRLAVSLQQYEGEYIMPGKAAEMADLAVDELRDALGIPDDDGEA